MLRNKLGWLSLASILRSIYDKIANYRTSMKAKLTLPKKINKKHLPLIFFSAGIIVFFLRRPDLVLHPQFWAEDGAEWYQRAYNHYFSPLTLGIPYAGYFGLFPRLTGLLSGLVGVTYAPLFFGIVALVVQAIPLLILWSERFALLVNSTKFKLYASFVYLTIPFTAEIHGSITNSQWYLAVAAFLLLFIRNPKNKILFVGELFLLGVACLSGPFSIFLVLLLALNHFIFKDRSVEKAKAFIVIGLALFHLFFIIFFFDHGRSSVQLGISVTYLLIILGAQIFGGGLLGYKSLTTLQSKGWIAPVIAIIGIEAMLYVLYKSPRMLKLFIIYGALIFLAALSSPNGPLPGLTWWQTLSTLQAGGRYYFMLHLAVLLSVGWLAFASRNIIAKGVGIIAILALIIIGIPADFHYYPPPDRHYHSFVEKYQAAKHGQVVRTTINPGGQWVLVLRKH
jgi:hypothetical protein